MLTPSSPAWKTDTAVDWQIVAQDFLAHAAKLPERILAHLKLLDGDFAGFPIDRLSHSL
jgi:hypothetical protein